MQSQTGTTEASGRPFAFPSVPPVKKKVRKVDSIDVDLLVIENTPMPSQVRRSNNKYEPIFSKLKPGQCIRCEPSERNSIANALRKWVERKGLECTVRGIDRCEDGHGRVWLVPKPAEATTKTSA